MASRLAAAFADAGDRAYAIALVQSVCRLAAPYDYVENAQARLRRAGIVRAVRRHDTAALFDWIAAIVSLQGISDAVALRYMRDHGPPRYNDIALRQKRRPQACPKLGSYWALWLRLSQGRGYLHGTLAAAALSLADARFAQRPPQPDGLQPLPVRS